MGTTVQYSKKNLNQGVFLGATDYLHFGLNETLPMGFKARDGSLVCTLGCLFIVILGVTSGAATAFSSNRGVYCLSMCTTGSIPDMPHGDRGGSQ